MTPAASRPLSTATTIARAEALAERRRGTRYVVPSSIWASTGQIDPGTYLPSWPTNMTRAAARTGSGDPMAPSSTRQDCIVHTVAAITQTRAPMAVSGPILVSAVCTPSHSSARAQQPRAIAANANPYRVARLRRIRCPVLSSALRREGGGTGGVGKGGAPSSSPDRSLMAASVGSSSAGRSGMARASGYGSGIRKFSTLPLQRNTRV